MMSALFETEYTNDLTFVIYMLATYNPVAKWDGGWGT